MPMIEVDRTRLRDALALAQQAIGVSEPNPRVGCVIGLADGTVLGSGWTQQAGGPHAEVMALRDAKAEGNDVRGATVWVTLEPCAHHGRTPPCCDALIDAGITRAVVAIEDPFPAVAGEGIARMCAAGITVAMADADIAAAARELNIGFFSRVLRGRPWVRLKVAASLDGRTALPSGVSQWITGPEARADGHAWRRRAAAVMTGIGTVLADDPRLDVRLVPTTLQPLRVVLDSRLQMPTSARLLQPPGPVLVVGAVPDAHRAEALREACAEVIFLPTADGSRVDLVALLAELGRRSVNEVHVEGGHRLNGALLASGLVDELLVYVAPILVGDGLGLADIGRLPTLGAALRGRFIEACSVGQDLRIRLRTDAEGALRPAADV
jgi:diaminohydroxyphosphoribosylaminopyrimidine deaminase/5-amino-6-(5-phosphoribosylamino)uracil reductase